MRREFLEIKETRFNLANPDEYIIKGSWPKEGQPEARMGKKKLAVKVLDDDTVNALERFQDLSGRQVKNVSVHVKLPKKISSGEKLFIFCKDEYGQGVLWWKESGKKLAEDQNKPQVFFEEMQLDWKSHSCTLSGWAVHQMPVDIQLKDKKGNVIPCERKRYQRADVAHAYPECEISDQCGFWIYAENLKDSEVSVCFTAGKVQYTEKINIHPVAAGIRKVDTYWKKTIRYTNTHGVLQLPKKVVGNLFSDKKPIQYKDWIKKHRVTEKELRMQRRTEFSLRPKFSIVVPLYRTPVDFLEKLIVSICSQSYENWELCLSDGSGADSPLSEFLKSKMQADARIKVVSHKTALRIAENTNAAIGIASGDYVVFADHDDLLEPNALYECAKAINTQKPDVIYSDEDKVSISGKAFFQPQMKPDFNLDLLCTVNYICHLFVVKKSLLSKVGMLRPEFDGAQDYDLILRCVENTSAIYHIPKVLYHWRSHENSTAENPESKLYAFEAGKRAVQEHYNRIGIAAEVSMGEFPGLYRTRFLRADDPLISIIIPNKDHIDDLKRCIDSIEQKSSYRNYEFIIVENNSEEEETFLYYQQLESLNPKIHVVYWKGEFNYSKINNYGVRYAKGEYLLLLNNDTEAIYESCLEELLGYCMRPDVGAVGARLYYEDDTIQHAGVVIGFGGIAGHCFVQQKRGATGYCHRIICAQDYSAVTAACMMVKRQVYEEVGGLTEEFAVAFNDIDFCMKIRKAGYLIVYNPYAELYHYESKSRGLDDTPEKAARFGREIAKFEERWPEILKNGDPYYSPNLTLESQDFSLRRI